MKYSQFIKKLESSVYNSPIKEEVRIQGNHVVVLENGDVFMNRRHTSFLSLDEAIKFTKREMYRDLAWIKAFDNISANSIASIIREHSSEKITNSLIESYLDEAFDKVLTTNPITLKIRDLVSLNSVDNKIDFVLEDGSTVAIGKTLLEKLNSENDKYINNMRKSIDSFNMLLATLVK